MCSLFRNWKVCCRCSPPFSFYPTSVLLQKKKQWWGACLDICVEIVVKINQGWLKKVWSWLAKNLSFVKEMHCEVAGNVGTVETSGDSGRRKQHPQPIYVSLLFLWQTSSSKTHSSPWNDWQWCAFRSLFFLIRPGESVPERLKDRLWWKSMFLTWLAWTTHIIDK